jgi:hypothetical protein
MQKIVVTIFFGTTLKCNKIILSDSSQVLTSCQTFDLQNLHIGKVSINAISVCEPKDNLCNIHCNVLNAKAWTPTRGGLE